MALRRKNAQVAVISLWVVLVLAVMAVSLGHRLSMGLRLAGRQRENLKSLYQAKAELNLAVSALESDDPAYDALSDDWAQEDQDGLVEIADEERKININTAPRELLTALLQEYNFTDIEEKVNNLLIWRGEIADEGKIYDGLGYPCKAAALANIQELLLVKDFGTEEYRLLKDVITVVYSGDKININTASEEVLTILANSVAQGSEQQAAVSNVASSIIAIRSDPNRGPFKNMESATIDAQAGSPDEALFNNLKPKLTVASSYFMIASSGNAGKIKSTIQAVYNRAAKKIIYWHER